MENARRFIKIGEDRIDVEDIASYGLGTDEDEDNFIYINVKTGEDSFQYYAEDVDFELEEKLAELDEFLLIRKLGHVDFERR